MVSSGYRLLSKEPGENQTLRSYLHIIKVCQGNGLYRVTGLHLYLSEQAEQSPVLTVTFKEDITYCQNSVQQSCTVGI